MNDDEVVAALQSASRDSTAVELANLLFELTGTPVGQGSLVTFFKRAFPEIPLRLLLDAGGWVGIRDGWIPDDEFDSLFAPWLDCRGER